jgi:glycogen debranching enzyme
MSSTQSPRNIARAVVIKAGDIFLLSERTGQIPAGSEDGFGLYYRDCRFLNAYELRISGTHPNGLVSSASRGSSAQFELTNHAIQGSNGGLIKEQTFGITVERTADGDRLVITDLFTIENYDVEEHELVLSFSFQSDFEDIFEIRGLHPKKTGTANQPKWQDGVLILSYNGADGTMRSLEMHSDPKPHKTSETTAEFHLKFAAGQTQKIKLSLRIQESQEESGATRRGADHRTAEKTTHSRAQVSLDRYAEVSSDSELLNRVISRSLHDLSMLQSMFDGLSFYAAGLPWYGTLFGRDSIIAALEMLAYEPQIAEQTIRLLAKYQGTQSDRWRDEEPGKILHEFRHGELAHLDEIPQTPYYGAVDSTPLFLILIGEHANWTGDLTLFRDLKDNVDRALEWIDRYGTGVCDRYVSYLRKSSKGLSNQGWKDSGDSIMNADGSLATQPIALVEVQGYVYRAKLLIADLYARTGDKDKASRLRQQATELKSHFNRDFWINEKQFYAIALQKDGRPAEVISSNPGQALWSGIVDEDKAAAVVRNLTAKDMFSGWGIRTLSRNERRFNPIGYHLGTVWPHDNAIIAAGFRLYGFDDEALQILEGIVHAAEDFEHFRLPEVFAGFTRNDFPVPVRYPVACHPQAWAAGSVPFMVSSLLGLAADASNRCLRVVRPVLPRQINKLQFRRIKVADSTVDLRFERSSDGSIHVDVANNPGNIKVEVESQRHLKAA